MSYRCLTPELAAHLDNLQLDFTEQVSDNPSYVSAGDLLTAEKVLREAIITIKEGDNEIADVSLKASGAQLQSLFTVWTILILSLGSEAGIAFSKVIEVALQTSGINLSDDEAEESETCN